MNQIFGFFLVRLHRGCEWQATIEQVLLPSSIRLSVISVHELMERQRIDMDFISASTKFRQDIRGKESGIAASHIGIDIALVEQRVQDGLELTKILYFVQEDIVVPVICHLLVQIRNESIWIPELLVFQAVEFHDKDMVRRDTRAEQMRPKELQQQIRLPAAPDASDDFDQAVVHAMDELVQIDVTFDLHDSSSY